MSVKCEVVKDLLPLYIDGVCSEESKKTVEEHLLNCKSCKEEMELLTADLKTVSAKTEDKKIVKAANAVIKKGKKKSFLVGCLIALCAVLVLASAYTGYHWFSSVSGDDLDALAQAAEDYFHESELSVIKTAQRGNYLAALCTDKDGKWFMCEYDRDDVFKERFIASGGTIDFSPGELGSWNWGSPMGEAVLIFWGSELSGDAHFYAFQNNGITYICPIENKTVLDIFIIPNGGSDINADFTLLDEYRQPLKDGE